MRYSNPNNPAQVRARIQTTYDAYASGQILLPKLRCRVPVQDLPPRTRHAASLLAVAWAEIDSDNAMFEDALVSTVNFMLARKAPKPSMVAVNLGRNAARFAHVQIGENEGPQIEIGTWSKRDFLEVYGGVTQEFPNGSKVTLGEKVQGELSGVVIRPGHTMGVFTGGDGEAALELLNGLGAVPAIRHIELPSELEE